MTKGVYIMSTKIRLYDAVCRRGRIDHDRLTEFAEEIACSITEDANEQNWYIRFLMISVHYVFAECNIYEQTFLSLLKLAKVTKRDEYDMSAFDILLENMTDLGAQTDLVLQLMKEYSLIAGTRPKKARKKLQKALQQYQDVHKIKTFNNNLFVSALSLFEGFCNDYSECYEIEEFETYYQYVVDAVEIANEYHVLSDESCSIMMSKLNEIHTDQRLHNPDPEKL